MSEKSKTEPNLPLRVIATLFIVMNIILLGISIYHVSTLGWLSIAIVCGSLTSILFSVKAIKTNDPTWLMLDLIIPG